MRFPTTLSFLPAVLTLLLSFSAGGGNLLPAQTSTPSADFTAQPRSGEVPLTVTFQNRSQGNITQVEWDFGDGNTSTEPSPTHTYTSAGNYTVSLWVSDGTTIGTDTRVRTDYITVDPEPFVVNFEANLENELGNRGGAPATWEFTNTSTGGPFVIRTWDFGDGNTATFPNPSHTYSEPGIYTVSLTLTTSSGFETDTLVKEDFIEVHEYGVHFSADPVQGSAPLTVAFTDDSFPPVLTSYSNPVWDLGDGTTTTAANPLHIYTEPGTYTVSLSVDVAVAGFPAEGITTTREDLIQVGSPREMGDFTGSGCTGFDDFLFLLDNWGQEVDGEEMGFGDFTSLLEHWGTGPDC